MKYKNLKYWQTFHIVPKISAIQTLPLVWVFTYKFDTNGYLSKYKAHLCVWGDLQQLTQQDNYAATLGARIFHALMAITAAFDLEAWQLDAISIFTNSFLDETVHCDFPDRFGQDGSCILLLRALYGLSRSPLLWLRELSHTLRDLGLI